MIRVAGLDEKSSGDEDGQRNDSEGVEEDIGSGKRREDTVEDATVAQHGKMIVMCPTKLMKVLLLQKSH